MGIGGEPTSLRDRNRLRVRGDIIDAVAESLGDVGMAGTTLDEIRRRAGVSRATLYSYFPGGRDEMVREAYVRAAEAVYVRGIGLWDEAGSTPDRVVALAVALIEHAVTAEGRFYGVMGPDVAAAVSGVVGSTSRPFEDLIRRELNAAVGAGRLAPGSPVDALASCLTGLIRSAGASAAQRPDTADDQLAAVGQIVRSLVAAPDEVTG